MIVIEMINGGELIRHYSDAGFLIEQVETGYRYSEAIDIVPCPYTYIETDEPIEIPEDPEAPIESEYIEVNPEFL